MDSSTGPVREFFDALQRLHREAGAPSTAAVAEFIGLSTIDALAVGQVLYGPELPPWDAVALVFAAFERNVRPEMQQPLVAALYQLWLRAGSDLVTVPPAPEPSVVVAAGEPAAVQAVEWAVQWAPACPVHGNGSMVRPVPAVYAEGTAWMFSSGQGVDTARGEMVVGAAPGPGTVASLRAAWLKPQPRTRSASGPVTCAIVIGALGAFIGGTLYSAASPGADGGTALLAFWLVSPMAAAVAALIGTAVRIRRRRKRIERGMPSVMAYWQSAWYCGQCDGVFFTPGWEPPGVIPGRLLPIAAFQQAIWAAAGFTGTGAPIPGRA